MAHPDRSGSVEKKNHPRYGTKYLKPMLQRVARERPDRLHRACERVLEDAAGETQVEHAATYEGGVQKYRTEIEPADRHRALAMFGDRVDGKPLQEIAVEPGAITNVIVLRAKLGEEPELPESVKAILAAKDQEADDPLGEADEGE